VENLACYVDKEEKTEIELIIRAYLVERISQVANTGHLVVLHQLRLGNNFIYQGYCPSRWWIIQYALLMA